jgi:hypothetical protein
MKPVTRILIICLVAALLLVVPCNFHKWQCRRAEATDCPD